MGRARGEPDRRHPGQPVRENGRSKRGSKGYDAGKKIRGRKRHILTDTDGRLLTIQVHGANIQDRDGAKAVLKRSRARFPFVQHAYVDGGYAGRLVRWAKDKAHIVLEVVKRSAKQTGFAVIRRRWVVERTDTVGEITKGGKSRLYFALWLSKEGQGSCFCPDW